MTAISARRSYAVIMTASWLVVTVAVLGSSQDSGLLGLVLGGIMTCIAMEVSET